MLQDASPVHAPISGLAEAYAGLRHDLLRFLKARVGDPAVAEELLHDLWVRLQAEPSGPVGNPRAYLYRACQNLALDRARGLMRQRRRDGEWMALQARPGKGEPADGRPTAEESLIEREDLARLAAAIAALPEGAGRAFRLHRLDGLSHAEIAARLGISRSGVEKHMAVAMVHLRRAMND